MCSFTELSRYFAAFKVLQIFQKIRVPLLNQLVQEKITYDVVLILIHTQDPSTHCQIYN